MLAMGESETTDKVGTAAPLNVERRIAWLSRHIDLREKRILDVGCGYGRWTMKFAEFSDEVYGLEPSEEEVSSFRQRNSTRATVTQGVSEAIPYPDAFFDLVFLNEVIEHVADVDRTLNEIRRVLRPGAMLAVLCPNRLYPFETHGVKLASGRMLRPVVPFIPYLPTALGSRLFTYMARNYFPWEMRGLLRRHGFEVVSSGFVWQTFENISGVSPVLVRKLAPVLRAISLTLEKVPLFRAFGVSQAHICRKGPRAEGHSQ